MASTNKTTHYELSQFVGGDKPAWLGDYNSDMSKIDTGINTAQTTATGADGKADANTIAIGTIANLTTDAKTNLVVAVNEVDSHADTAQGTANSAETKANSALTKVGNLESALNFGSATNVTWSTTIGTVSENSVKVVANTAGSIAKIYGYMKVSNTSSTSNIVLTSSDTGLRPASSINFKSCGFRQAFYTTPVGGSTVYIPLTAELSYTLGTDGIITITISNDTTITSHDLVFIATLLSIKTIGE